MSERTRRVVIYAILTGIIQSFLWVLIFNTDYETPHRMWLYYLAENFALLIFPLGYGPAAAGVFGMIMGIIFMFLIITAIGELLIWLNRRNKS